MEPDVETDTGPTGLGGWLGLLSCVVVFTPFVLAYNVVSAIRESWGSLGMLQAVSLAWFFVLIAWSGANVVLLLWQHKIFPLSWMACSLALVLGMVLEGDAARTVVPSMVSVVLWSAYLLNSKRVKKTFVEG